MKIHIVQSDDSLTKLAKKYHISEDQIVKANPDLDKDQQLKTGSKIYIPSGKISLTKESEKKAEPTQKGQDLARELERSEFPIESSDRREHDSDSRVEFEDDYPEPISFPVGWAPYPPMPSQFWGCSYYHMVPPNLYLNMEPIRAMQLPPYYYPYTYGPSFGEDPYYDMSFSDESSSYYTKTKWKPNWPEKESSSVEG